MFYEQNKHCSPKKAARERKIMAAAPALHALRLEIETLYEQGVCIECFAGYNSMVVDAVEDGIVVEIRSDVRFAIRIVDVRVVRLVRRRPS